MRQRHPPGRPVRCPVLPAAAALLAVLLAGCGGRAHPDRSREDRPSLLLITIDTLRADHVGCYGYAGAVTPALDRLAREGVRFSQAMTAVPLTLPAHATLLTGLYPPAHGVRNNGMYALSPSVTTLAEALSVKGYHTGAFVSAYPVASSFGLSQGFEVYDERFLVAPGEGFFYAERRAGETTAAARAWLASLPPAQPFFAWVHYFDPHANYDPPPSFAVRFPGRPYDGEIAYADSCLGELLDFLEKSGRMEATLVVATSDHGEGLGEHGEFTHGLFLYESTLHVPLIIRGAAAVLAPGRVIEEPVGLADVFPTVIDLLGAGPTGPVQGRSLVPLLAASSRPPNGWVAQQSQGLYAETLMPSLEFGWAELTALRRGPWKWVEAPRPELYDLSSDPGETTNRSSLAGGEPGESLRAGLARLRSSLEVAGAEEHSRRSLGDEEIARLRSLGYLQGGGRVGSPAGRDGGPRDPKDGVALLARIEEAKALARQGRHDRAIELFRAVLAEEPTNTVARWRLVETLLAAGRAPEAEDLLSKTDSRPAGCYWVAGLRAQARQAVGDREGAVVLYRAAVEREPEPSDPALRGAILLWDMGRQREALELAQRGLARGASRPALAELAGDLARESGDPALAAHYYLDSLRRDPGHDRAWSSLASTAFGRPGILPDLSEVRGLAVTAGDLPGAKLVLGLIDYVGGDAAAAVVSLRRAREMKPDDPDVSYFLGLSLLESGDLPGAEQVLAPFAASRPDLFQSQRALAVLRGKQGRRDEAIALLRRALTLKPGDPACREELAKLGAAAR